MRWKTIAITGDTMKAEQLFDVRGHATFITGGARGDFGAPLGCNGA